MSSQLQIRNLSVDLSGKNVLDELNLDLPHGQVIGLIGPNGAGKSTLLRSCLKLTPAKGTVNFEGQDLLLLSAKERARYLSFLPQARELAWAMNVAAVVRLGLPLSAPIAKQDPRSDTERVDEAIALLELGDLRHRQASDLSGGELARVLLARLLVQDTPIILADEPLAGLDPQQQIKVMRLFQTLSRAGKTIFASIHDLTQAALWCDHLVLLECGKVTKQGTPRQVLTADSLASVYHIAADIRDVDGKVIVTPLATLD